MVPLQTRVSSQPRVKVTLQPARIREVVVDAIIAEVVVVGAAVETIVVDAVATTVVHARTKTASSPRLVTSPSLATREDEVVAVTVATEVAVAAAMVTGSVEVAEARDPRQPAVTKLELPAVITSPLLRRAERRQQVVLDQVSEIE